MQNTLFSPIPLDTLRRLISDSVKVEVEKFSSLYQPQQNNDLITREDTAKLLGISLPTLHSWSKLGIIPSYRIGTRIRYKKEEVLNSVSKVQSIKYGRL